MIDATMKVREIALTPEATRILETLKIDYCCGGERPLGEACELAGVDLQELEQKLDEAQQAQATSDAPVDFQKMSLMQLTKYIIEKHHVFTQNEIHRLESLTARVIAAHGMNHPELISIGKVVRALCADLKPHMFKEEQILFPCMIELENALAQNRPAPFMPFGTVTNPIRMMMLEHDNAGAFLKELRSLSSDYAIPDDACLSYSTLYQALEAFERDLHQHIHLENNILFPKAIELQTTRQ